jgi:hypothetical protein
MFCLPQNCSSLPPKPQTQWAGNVYGTYDAVIMTVPSLGEGVPWNARFRTSKEVKGRVTSRSENGAMPACPHPHSKTCLQRHRAHPGRDAEEVETRREGGPMLFVRHRYCILRSIIRRPSDADQSIHAGCSSLRMGSAGYAVGSSTALAAARARSMRFRAEVSVPSTARLCDVERANRPSMQLGHKVHGVASDRHHRLEGSRASPTTFKTNRQIGAAPSHRPESRCAEHRMKWLTWMLAPVLALGWVVAASATVRIHSDPGGRIDQYLDRYNQIRLSGQHVIVDGTCNSACTLLLGSVPRDKICFTEQASLGFHSAWQFDDSGRPVASPSWTRVLWRNYPRAVRTWIARHGGLTPRMIFLRGEALTALYPRCTAAALLNYQ